VLGPMLGTPVLILIGAAACFFLTGLSFFVVVFALMSLHIVHTPQAAPNRIMHDLRGGLEYVRSEPAIRMLTVLVFFSTFLSWPLTTFLPYFAMSVLSGGSYETRLAGLMIAQGMGAIAGALIIAGLGKFANMGRTLLSIQIGLGVLLALFAATRWLPLSYVLLFVAGASSMMMFSLSSSLVQLVVPDRLRGRVMSIYMLALRGGGPIGAFTSGWIATYFSAPRMLAANGGLLTLLALYYLVVKKSGVRDL
jgi:Na+/melibiose symporter-like transporter